MSSSISSSSSVESYDTSNQVDKKNNKRNIKKKKEKQKTKSQPTTSHSAESVDIPTKTPRKPKFPCRICKRDDILMDCHGLSQVLEVW